MSLSRFMHPVHIVALCLGIAVFTGCQQRPPRSEKPLVVCTIFPLASLVQQMVGPDVEVVTAVPAGVSPHGYEPTGRQVATMQSAWLIVSVGLGYDEWAHTASERASIPLVEMGEVVTLPKSAVEGGPGEATDDHDHKHDDDHGHDHHHHGVANPHIWIDPVLAMEFVDKLAPKLAEITGHGEQVKANVARLKDDLAVLDAELKQKLAPFAGARLVTYHNAFDLLAERYGMEVAATLTPVDSPAGMTPARLQQAIRVVREHHVKAVFAEPQFPNEAGRAVQQETGVKVLTLDCLGDPGVPERGSYQTLLRYNLAQLLEGLK